LKKEERQERLLLTGREKNNNMKRRNFIQTISLALGATVLPTQSMKMLSTKMKIRLIRHATLIIEAGNVKFLVDPMLSAKGAMDPVQNCGNDIRIPMTDLPLDEQTLHQLLEDVDAIVITHTHRDHWDVAAQQLIAKNKLVFCQPADLEKLKQQGFTSIIAIEKESSFADIKIFRTRGRHGTGETGKKMGEVSGFVFKKESDVIYLAGDTIWCDDVSEALQQHRPTVTIVNAGGAKFLTGDPITMTPSDIIAVHEALPSTHIMAVHMDTVNHCLVTRKDLKGELAKANITCVSIPQDGEWVSV
jgi:L-ascorbate metabolism protein UlaG (beta-lactamase superfamily)